MTFDASSMTAVKRGACAALVLASVAVLPSVARADASRAEALFREGRALLDAKRFDEACPKLAEAQKQEPGAGTLLALALCHEGQGKTATAWSELNQAAVIGKGVGRNDLAAAAQKRAQLMEPQLAKLVVRMPRTEDVEYDVKCDGDPVEAKALGTPLPVDPGEHRIDVSAKGKVSRSYAVRLSGAGVVEIVVDRLDDAPRAALVAPKSASPRVQALTTEPPAPAEDNRGRTQRVLGVGVIGLGLVGIGTGAYFAGRAISLRSDGRKACTSSPCPPETNDANDRAKSAFNMSVTSIAAGTGAIALGTIIYLLAPSSPSSSGTTATGPTIRRTARITPEVSPTEVSMGVSGAF